MPDAPAARFPTELHLAGGQQAGVVRQLPRISYLGPMRIMLLCGWLVLLAASVHAQQSLSPAVMPAPGDTAVYSQVGAAGLAPGPGGMVTSWDFRPASRQDSLRIDWQAPAAVPGSGAFPTASLAGRWFTLAAPNGFGVLGNPAGRGPAFFRLNGDTLVCLGQSFAQQVLPAGPGAQLTLLQQAAPIVPAAEVILPTGFSLPADLNDTLRQQSFTQEIRAELHVGGFVDSILFRRHVAVTLVSDGFGLLRTPAGDFPNAFRVRTHITGHDSILVSDGSGGYGWDPARGSQASLTQQIRYDWHTDSLFRVMSLTMQDGSQIAGHYRGAPIRWAGFPRADTSFPETTGQVQLPVRIRPEPPTDSVRVEVVPVAGSANLGVDVVAVADTLTIQPDSHQTMYSVVIQTDTLTEGPEPFSLALRVLSGPAVTDTLDTLRVSILDEQRIGWRFEPPVAMAEEADSGVSVSIRLDRPAPDSLNLRLRLGSPGDPAEAIEDYVPFPPGQALHFLPGEQQQSILVQLVNDSVAEAAEFFHLHATAQDSRLFPVRDSMQVRIGANDFFPTVSFAGTDTALFEAIRTIALPLRLNVPAEAPLAVAFQTVPRNATPGMDYVPVADSVNFQPGDSLLFASIDILNDLEPNEGPESLLVVLTGVSGFGLLGQPDTLQITLTDNDPTGRTAAAGQSIRIAPNPAHGEFRLLGLPRDQALQQAGLIAADGRRYPLPLPAGRPPEWRLPAGFAPGLHVLRIRIGGRWLHRRLLIHASD